MEVSYGSGLGWLLKRTSTKAVHEKRVTATGLGTGHMMMMMMMMMMMNLAGYSPTFQSLVASNVKAAGHRVFK